MGFTSKPQKFCQCGAKIITAQGPKKWCPECEVNRKIEYDRKRNASRKRNVKRAK